MKQVWKRRAVAAAVVVLVGTSVYLNWRYAGNVEETSKVLGQSTLVNGQTTEAQADTSSDGGEDYFSTARLSRKQARDTAISMLEDAKGEENASEEVANEASETLQVLAGYTVAETQIENLVVAKGYADCVAFMGADSISVVVSAPDGWRRRTWRRSRILSSRRRRITRGRSRSWRPERAKENKCCIFAGKMV